MRTRVYLVLASLIGAMLALATRCEAQEKGVVKKESIEKSVVAKAVDSSKYKVEFRWIEPKAIDGLTEDWGRSIDCGKGKWFPHKKCVLTSEDIQSIRMTESYSVGTPRFRYCLQFELSDSAIKKLVDACGEEDGKRLAFVFVNENGKNVVTSPFLTNSYFSKQTAGEFRVPSSGSAPREITDQVLAATKFQGKIPFEPSSWRKSK